MDARYSSALEDQLMWGRTIGDLVSHARQNAARHKDIDVEPVESIRQIVLSGGTYYWTPPIETLITEGAATLDPSWLVVEDGQQPPTVSGFCVLAKGIEAACPEHDNCMTLKRLLWHRYRWQSGDTETVQTSVVPAVGQVVCIVVGIFLVTATNEFAVGGCVFLEGETIEAALARPFSRFFGAWSEAADLGPMLITVFSAAMRFMAEPLVSVSHHRPDRATRRRVERSEYQNEPLVRVIELRRKEYQRQETDDHQDVEWSCQWIVRGHWHRYQTKDGLQPRWVAPYVKGPDDKPLKRPRAEVFAVVR